jgi:hypothetical protein
MARSTAYVPIVGDHWLRTEWSSIRHKLPSVHGTQQDAIKSLHDRVRFLTGRGWRVTSQKMLDDTTGERRMLVRVVPPSEYAHCGESVIEYRSCGGVSFCKLCESEHARINGIHADVSELPDDPEQARCAPDFDHGVCRQCGLGLRAHMPREAREAVAAFWGE